MVSSLLSVAVWVACVAGTGASPTTVNGTWGQSVFLPPGLPVGPDVAEVVWRLLTPRKKIVTYSNKISDYYGPEEYKRRITFHPGNFSLEIRDLQIEDIGDYEVTVTASSGAQTQNKMRLKVCEWMETVKGLWGQWVSLPAGITGGLDVSQVVWRRDGTTIAEYANGVISYFGPEEYKRRITLYPGNFSLKIRDLQREDTGDYEVTVTPSRGGQIQAEMRLEVNDPADRSSHAAWIIPLVVILILLLVCCCIYRKREYLRSHWDKCMGKKSGTSDGARVRDITESVAFLTGKVRSQKSGSTSVPVTEAERVMNSCKVHSGSEVLR
ncbi:uncharacterized protein [Mobula birostris]|uniref:uncharacterized protein isoform X4 n=1 Tax=Mobula birostris TaxID=1983395 RepID=UPI003B289CEC